MRGISLFFITLTVLMLTIVPTIYPLDSGELVTGAATLGIVHSPGYPLYLLTLHIFLKLPVGDLAFRGNLFSALCLALTSPILYGLLWELTRQRLAALVATLLFVWSFYVWVPGLFAEVYTPQILTLTICGYWIVQLRHGISAWRLALVGLTFGIAVAFHPSSVLMAPGLVVVFLVLKIKWRDRVWAGLLSIAVVLVCMFYFPLSYNGDPQLNLAGTYDSEGIFRPVDLNTLDGLLWMVSGQQFDNLFFDDGLLPLDRAIETVELFVVNYLGVAFLIGLGAICVMPYRQIWLAFFLPFVIFYTAYGAADRLVMFGPALMLWAVLIAYGFGWLEDNTPRWFFNPFSVLILVMTLTINFQRLNLSDEWGTRHEAESLMAALPQDALVFGHWQEIVPLEYLHIVEGVRQDIRLYNLFLFEAEDAREFIGSRERPVIVLMQTQDTAHFLHYEHQIGPLTWTGQNHIKASQVFTLFP